MHLDKKYANNTSKKYSKKDAVYKCRKTSPTFKKSLRRRFEIYLNQYINWST